MVFAGWQTTEQQAHRERAIYPQWEKGRAEITKTNEEGQNDDDAHNAFCRNVLYARKKENVNIKLEK